MSCCRPSRPARRSTCTRWTRPSTSPSRRPRYSEATLIKALEKEAIGRPSTYAPIIQTIQDRQYVEQKERRFFATDLGMVVTDFLVERFPKILDLKFTAHMEDELDGIASAKEDMVKVLDEFYYPFQESLKTATEQAERVQILTEETCHVCGAPMVLKFGRTGQFLGCSKYPECKATRPIGGEPRAEAVESEHACPKCGKPLMIRENKRGEKFLSCSGYPECKESFNIDEAGNPVPSVVETEYTCEKCGKPMALRQSARGAFLGCTGYPKCRNAMPVDEQGKPVPPVKVEIPCPKCGGAMAVRQGRRGLVPRLHQLSQVPRDSAGARRTQGAARRAGRPPRPNRGRTSSRSRSRRPASSAAARCSSAAAAAGSSSAAPSIPSARGRASPARPRSPRSTRSSGPEPLPSARGRGCPGALVKRRRGHRDGGRAGATLNSRSPKRTAQ